MRLKASGNNRRGFRKYHCNSRQCGQQCLSIVMGISYVSADPQIVAVKAPDVATVVDTTGAGDAFLGGLIRGESVAE